MPRAHAPFPQVKGPEGKLSATGRAIASVMGSVPHSTLSADADAPPKR